MKCIEAQARREGFQLTRPVEKQAPGHDEQRRGLHSGVQLAKQGDRLHGFAEAHVVGQAPAQSVFVEVIQPLNPSGLIRAQLPAEPAHRHGTFRQEVEPAENLTRFWQGGRGLALVEQILDERKIKKRYPHPAAGLFEEPFQAGHEAGIHHRLVAVGQGDELVFPILPERVEQGDPLAFKVQVAIALKEIDAVPQIQPQLGLAVNDFIAAQLFRTKESEPLGELAKMPDKKLPGEPRPEQKGFGAYLAKIDIWTPALPGFWETPTNPPRLPRTSKRTN